MKKKNNFSYNAECGVWNKIFSRFVPEGSQRISSIKNGLHDIKHIAFLTPEKAVVLVLMNP